MSVFLETFIYNIVDLLMFVKNSPWQQLKGNAGGTLMVFIVVQYEKLWRRFFYIFLCP